ncbi:DUF2589 domain-containing protein [Aquimarina hainanensis]|uniref:DUF2589 domain-containing protein n=1 Tax=Aquimarina hainanensis TaxID=1578017 RepID=A0ABW5NAI6_9FLAO|nr:DUF2589 domain-containing protein [Aquimarina sp. TRL1]QKX06939.1 DUF2589 domain-containing protein [Aquimarina sp. TRL1]
MAKKTPNNSQGIAIEQLLAAPFVAAASANAAMAKKQTAFLMDTCFDVENDDGFGEDVYHPKMISMTITKNTLLSDKEEKGTPKMEQVTSTFQVPLLTLIPFNSLSVKEVNVKFDLEIISQNDESVTTTKKGEKGKDEAQLKGAVSYDSSTKEQNQYQRRNASKLSVEMNAGTLPLPVGFTALLDLYTKNISSSSLERKAITANK